MTKKEKTEKIKTAIDTLNEIVKIRVGVSSVHGVGVIAMRDLKKGEKLQADAIPHAFDVPYTQFKKLRPEIRQLLLERWPQIVNGSPFLYPDTKMGAYMNHSDTPNYDPINDKMLKNVKAEEEIFEDYRNIDGYALAFPWLVVK